MSRYVDIREVSRKDREPLTHVENDELMPLPAPLDSPDKDHPWTPLSSTTKQNCECGLDDTCALNLPQPKTPEEEAELVRKFLSGLEKLFTKENNWTFLQPLLLTMEHCAKCQTCSDACHIYEASGRNEALPSDLPLRDPAPPLFQVRQARRAGFGLAARRHRAELAAGGAAGRACPTAATCAGAARRPVPSAPTTAWWRTNCAKLFSQEMGIAAKEIHDNGSMLQLKVGSSTGHERRQPSRTTSSSSTRTCSEKTGMEVKTPWDVEGADILLIHNAGEIMAWPENPGAFALILNAAGITWTMSSELAGYDSINYGLWYDDAQFARVALKHAEAAEKLKVKKIVLGECGHAHKALMRDRRPHADRRPEHSARKLA